MLISGSLVYDHIMNFPDTFRRHILPEQMHILNVSFIVDKLERSWGGTAGNIAHTVRLLGGNPRIVSAVGKDGDAYLAHFKKYGIPVAHIRQDDAQMTASAYITTDADDNQITAFFAGPLQRVADMDIRELLEPGGIALISPTHKDVMMRHMRDCAGAGMRAVFDPGQQITVFNDAELKDMISRSEFVIGNDYEIKLLQDRTGWGAKEILETAKTLIVTLGEKGSIISTRDGETIEIAPCSPTSFDDPTGAGDAYRAGFFFGIERGMPLTACGQVGSVAASYAIEEYGTQEHSFTPEIFCERYSKTYGEDITL
jgi:adenosine kinase